MKQLLIFCLMALLAFGIDLTVIDESRFTDIPITVNVTGEVIDPGPVSVSRDATVADVLKLKEPSADADLSVLNPDTVLKDHDLLVIPAKKEEIEPPRISINTADAEELTALNGIGPSTAEKIIAYRQEHGLFQNLQELMNVPGIGQTKYNAILDQITL